MTEALDADELNSLRAGLELLPCGAAVATEHEILGWNRQLSTMLRIDHALLPELTARPGAIVNSEGRALDADGADGGQSNLIGFRAPDGETVWLATSSHAIAFASQDEVRVVTCIDVTEHFEQLEVARAASAHDPLTTLLNRRGLTEVVANRGWRAVGVAFVDLDRFKSINDTHGHDAGDVVLRTVAQRLRTITRDGDVVARWGGDEFVVVTPSEVGPDETNGFLLDDRIEEAIAGQVALPNGEHVEVSVTTGSVDGDATGLAELIDAADRAMNERKVRSSRTAETTRDATVAIVGGLLEDIVGLAWQLGQGAPGTGTATITRLIESARDASSRLNATGSRPSGPSALPEDTQAAPRF